MIQMLMRILHRKSVMMKGKEKNLYQLGEIHGKRGGQEKGLLLHVSRLPHLALVAMRKDIRKEKENLKKGNQESKKEQNRQPQ